MSLLHLQGEIRAHAHVPACHECGKGSYRISKLSVHLDVVVFTSRCGLYTYCDQIYVHCVLFDLPTQYRVRHTPFLRNLWPLAVLCDETITLSGYLYAVGFDDPDNLPDPANKETNARDIYTRILAGGFACSHFTEDGKKYS